MHYSVLLQESLEYLAIRPDGIYVDMTAGLGGHSLAIAERFGYHIFDALMIAAALEASSDTLYSEDLQNGQKIGKLTIRDPFRK